MVIDDGQGRKMTAYLDKEGRVMLRPAGGPSKGRRYSAITAFRAVIWLMWGPPRPGAIATHFACDHHACLNPTHGRWGTIRSNRYEDRLLREFKAELAQQPRKERKAFIFENHPTRPLMLRQGFMWDAL